MQYSDIIRHELVQGVSERASFFLEKRSSRFVFSIQKGPEKNCNSLKVSLCFESIDPYVRFPFNVWVKAGASARVVRVIEINSTKPEIVFFLPLENQRFVSMELDCDAGIFDGCNSVNGRRFNVAVALSDAEVDTPVPRSALTSAIPHRASALDSSERGPRPIFVVGMYRSGTSILSWALGQHPNLWALEETGFLPMISNAAAGAWIRASSAKRSFADVYELSSARFSYHLASAIDGLLMELAKEHAMRCVIERANECSPNFDPRIQALRSLGAPKRRWVDGTPENIVSIAQLNQLFPEARFIHIVRHPVHVVASMMRFERIGGVSIPAAEASRKWYDRVMQGYLAEKALGSGVVMRVDYAELTADPRTMMNSIFAFLGEPSFDPAGDCYEVTINSSNVSIAELQEVSDMLAETELAELLRLYEEISDRDLRYYRPLADARREFHEAMSAKVEEFLAT
jgi:hypothetical protein